MGYNTIKSSAGTDTTKSLAFVIDNAFGPGANFGDRAGNENLVVFLTDGVSTVGVPGNNVGTEAPRLHAVTEMVRFGDIVMLISLNG